MLNLLGYPQPVAWPLAGFGLVSATSSTFPLVLHVTREIRLNLYV